MVKTRRILKRITSILFEFLIVATIFSLLHSNVFLLGFVPTPSMHPNVPVGSRIFAVRSVSNLYIGDLIVFEIPEISNEYYIKRLVGLSGDTVEINEGRLYINGEFLDLAKEFGVIGNLGENLICTDYGYFVLGDNLNNSLDSREIGRINPGKVAARVMFHRVF